MEQFFQQLINGLSLGSIYALIALGYTMVYGIINLINFAHGDIYMLGAFVGFFFTTRFHIGLFPSLIISMIVCGIIGVVIERVGYRPIRKATRIGALITAISISLFIEYGMMYFVGPETKTFPSLFPQKSIKVFSAVMDIRDIYILAITIFLMVVFQYVIQKTRSGKAMRAVAMDSDAAQLMGIDVNKTIASTFAMGSALAGAAGVLVGAYYNSINPLMGVVPGLKAFIAAVIGGIGVIPGAVFGGFFLGMTETMVSAYGGSLYKDAVAFAILILMLLVRPKGLFRRNVKEKV